MSRCIIIGFVDFEICNRAYACMSRSHPASADFESSLNNTMYQSERLALHTRDHSVQFFRGLKTVSLFMYSYLIQEASTGKILFDIF